MAILILTVFAVLQFLDFYSTARVLGKGGRELNPIVAYVIKKFGIAGLALLKIFIAIIPIGAYWLICLIAMPILTYYVYFMIAVTVIYGIVIISNFIQLNKEKS